MGYKFEDKGFFEKEKPMREWLLLQAQLQQEYANTTNAITLLELIEQVYGQSVTTGLMLCKAWSTTGQLDLLETKVTFLLAKCELTCEQRAAVYYCLSVARWKGNDKVGARKAHELYLSLISESVTS